MNLDKLLDILTYQKYKNNSEYKKEVGYPNKELSSQKIQLEVPR